MLMNSFGVFLVAATLMIGMVFLLKKWGRIEGRIRLIAKITFCVGAYIATVLAIGSIMLGDLQKPSRVDVSPFFALAGADLDEADVVINKLYNSRDELGEQFEIKYDPDNIPGCSYYHTQEIFSNVRINIRFYPDYEQAEEDSERYRIRYSSKTSYREVNISDDITALLFNSCVNRADGLGWYVISDRYVRTHIRIKNMVVVVDESVRNRKEIGKASSEAIKNLCDIL